MPRKSSRNILRDIIEEALAMPTRTERTMQDLALACDIPRTYFYALMDGMNSPRPYTRRKIASGLAKMTKRTVADITAKLDVYWDLL